MQGRILANFLKSLRLALTSTKPVQVGVDSHGNRYYEKPVNPNSEINRKRSERYLLMPDQVSLEQPWHELSGDTPKVNPEWERWLRHKRESPPTPEELESYERLRDTRIRGGQLFEKKYQEERQQMIKDGLISDKPDNETLEDTTKTTFPSRKGLETLPGERIIKNQD